MTTGSLCDCQGSSNTKNEYKTFYQKLDAEYFFIRWFFRKKAVFFEKTVENCFGGSFENFLGKGVFPQKLTYLFFFFFYNKRGIEYFIINSFFKKSCNFLRKQQKIVSEAKVYFERKEASDDKNE